ncbi:hypothetical protein [Desulforamulus reducens]|uniref:hypothetical protein n=1 Tax=Desulforamulus reducens TaxID=59610 RepID=UPI00030222C2|nr:hypothetical protein [Desulforamulus reducens]
MMKSAELAMDFSTITKQLESKSMGVNFYENTRCWLERKDSLATGQLAMGIIGLTGFYFVGQIIRILFN